MKGKIMRNVKVRELKSGDKVATDIGVVILIEDAREAWNNATDDRKSVWGAKAKPTGFYPNGEPVPSKLLGYPWVYKGLWAVQGNDFRDVAVID